MSGADKSLVMRCLSPCYWFVCDAKTADTLNSVGRVGLPFRCLQDEAAAFDAGSKVAWKSGVAGMDDMRDFQG